MACSVCTNVLVHKEFQWRQKYQYCSISSASLVWHKQSFLYHMVTFWYCNWKLFWLGKNAFQDPAFKTDLVHIKIMSTQFTTRTNNDLSLFNANIIYQSSLFRHAFLFIKCSQQICESVNRSVFHMYNPACRGTGNEQEIKHVLPNIQDQTLFLD